MSFAGYDAYKTTPPDEPGCLHAECARSLQKLEAAINELERTLDAITKSSALIIECRTLPPCPMPAPHIADCTCRGTGRHFECEACGRERVDGDCYAITAPSGRALRVGVECVFTEAANAIQQLPAPSTDGAP